MNKIYSYWEHLGYRIRFVFFLNKYKICSLLI